MDSLDIQQFIALIKSGKYWHQDITEGFIELYFKGGQFFRQEYQANPYSGERTSETIKMTESDIGSYFNTHKAADVMKNVV